LNLKKNKAILLNKLAGHSQAQRLVQYGKPMAQMPDNIVSPVKFFNKAVTKEPTIIEETDPT